MRVRDLIDNCRRLAALDRSPAVVEATQEAVTQDMPRQYALPYAAALPQAAFERTGAPATNLRGLYHELVQHLTDLAYLTPAFFADWHRRREADQSPPPATFDKLFAAARLFYAEDDFFRGEGGLIPAPPLAAEAGRRWLAEQLAVLVYRSSQYTSFDGELPVKVDYRVGERTAYGRSLAYRLRVYFYDYLADRRTAKRAAYFDHALLPYLYSLDNSLRGALADELPQRDDTNLRAAVQTVLLDADRLLYLFRKHNRFLPEHRQAYYLLYSLSDQQPLSPEEASGRLERLRRRAGRRIVRGGLHRDTGSNRLGVRLLQLGLWRAGFYTGALDGNFGALSHRAVLALVAQERAADRPGLGRRQLDRLVVTVDDQVVVDLRLLAKLLDYYAPPAPQEAEIEEELLFEAIDSEQDTARLLASEAAVRQHYGQLDRHPARRVYYGLRGLIRGAVRGLGRVVGWIAGAVRATLGAVFDFVKAALKRVREGITTLYNGFRYFGHYFLGRPFVSLGGAQTGGTPVQLTQFRVDFDVINLVDDRSTAKDIQNHLAYLSNLQQGAAYFLDIAFRLIRGIAALSAPIGWLHLAVYIARWVRAGWRGLASGRALGSVEQV